MGETNLENSRGDRGIRRQDRQRDAAVAGRAGDFHQGVVATPAGQGRKPKLASIRTGPFDFNPARSRRVAAAAAEGHDEADQRKAPAHEASPSWARAAATLRVNGASFFTISGGSGRDLSSPRVVHTRMR